MRNPNLERDIKATKEYAAAMAQAAAAVVLTVEALAPNVTGAYQRSIRATENRIETTDSFGHLIEFGSANNPPYAPLRTGVRAAGLRLDESQK